MNEPQYEYCDNGASATSLTPLFSNFKVGDLVTWTADKDIGIVIDVDTEDVSKGREHVFIEWLQDPRASGWHGAHPSLELLSSP